MRGRAVWAFGSGIGLWLAAGAAHAQCTKDTDCKGDRVCESGKCTSPLPPAPPPPPGDVAPSPPGDVAPSPPGDVAPAPPPSGASTEQPPVATPDTGLPPAAVESPPFVPVAPAAEAQAAPAAAVQPLKDEPPLERRSRAALVTGIIMVSVGPIALLGALSAKNAQEDCDDALADDYPDHRLPTSERYRMEKCDSYTVPLYALGIGGALLTVGGIPLILYGGKRVPRSTPAAQLEVAPWAAPAAGGLRLRLSL